MPDHFSGPDGGRSDEIREQQRGRSLLSSDDWMILNISRQFCRISGSGKMGKGREERQVEGQILFHLFQDP